MRVSKNAAWTAAVALSASVLTPLAAAPAMAADEPVAPVVQEIRWNSEVGGNLGYASSRTSCDVNGDGLPDAVSGDWFWDRTGGSNAGAVYVALGTHNPGSGSAFTSDGDARAASSGAGADAGIVRIDGAAVANQFAGMSVSCLNDINGDGLDDIAIGSNRTQKVWVVLGAHDFSPVDLSTLGARGFLVTSTEAVAQNTANPVVSRNFGYWVSGLGDVNNDGYNDFAITDNLYDGQTADNIGRVYVISGKDSVASVDIDTEAGAARVIATFDGFDTGGQILSAEDVGDVNGDGIDDFAAGSYTATPWGASPTAVGAAFVVFGSAQPLTVKASDLGSHGFTIRGPKRGGDRLGESVAGIGDINGDGKADILVGGGNGSSGGMAAVVFGSSSTETVYTNPTAGTAAAVYQCTGSASSNGDGICDDAAGPVERGYVLNGPASSNFGWASAGIEDLNGDGVPELLVGAYGADYNSLNNSGSVYVVYGKADGAGAYDASTITPEGTVDGFRLDGYAANAKLGRSVGNAGDFDGNGTPDILGGAQGATSNPLSYASVFLIADVRTKTSLSAQRLTVGSIGRLTATVSPLSASVVGAVDAGTVAFADGDSTIEGCESVGVNAQGVATCDLPTAFAVTGSHTFRAVYGGSHGAFLPSRTQLVGSVVAAPPSGSGGGSSGGGSSSGTSTSVTDTPAAPTASASAPVVVVVTPAVSATGAATATVSSAAITGAVATIAAGGTSGAVVLDVTTAAGTGSAVALTIPAAAFAQLAPAVTSLVISSDAGTVTLDRAAIAAVAAAVAAAGSGADVIVSLVPVAPTAPSASAAFEIAISVGGKSVTTFDGGTVSVRVPYTLPATQDAADVVVITRGANGDIELLPTTAGAGGVTFVTPHLSVFEIASTKAIKKSATPAKAAVASVKATKTSVTVKLKKVAGAKAVQITYGKKGTAKSGWKTKTVSAATLSVPITGLKANTAYTFTIKAYSTLTGYEGTKAVTTKVYGAPVSKTVTTKK